MEAQDIRRINTALIDRGYLNEEAAGDLDQFSTASQAAYRDYLEDNGIRTLTQAVSLHSLEDVQGDLLEDDLSQIVVAAPDEDEDELEEENEDELEEEQGDPPPAEDDTSTINLIGGETTEPGSTEQAETQEESEDEDEDSEDEDEDEDEEDEEDEDEENT